MQFGQYLGFGGLAVDALGVLVIGKFEVVLVVGVFFEGLAALFAAVLGIEVSVLLVLDVLQCD